jgi:hypothetical protein
MGKKVTKHGEEIYIAEEPRSAVIGKQQFPRFAQDDKTKSGDKIFIG